MHFLEAIESGCEGNDIQRECWSPNYSIHAGVEGYLEYEDSLGSRYRFTEEDVYATDWAVKERTCSFPEAIEYLKEGSYKICRKGWTQGENGTRWQAFEILNGEFLLYFKKFGPYEKKGDIFVVEPEDIMADDWVVYDKMWNNVI